VNEGEKNEKLGAFVTNKWLVGTLVVFIMSMGGYIFKGIDHGTEVQAAQIAALEKRTQAAELDLAQIRLTQTLQYAEIIRRLDRMESALYGAGAQNRRDGTYSRP